jgi:hypothetical protein
MSSRSSDPVIDEIRKVRHQISAQFAHDPKALVAYYIELQKKFNNRLTDVERGNHNANSAAISR